jgi:biotin synthase
MVSVKEILSKNNFDKSDLIALLSAKDGDRTLIFEKAAEIKSIFVGRKVYFRGLIEFSNICAKNCLYCGIRAGNNKTQRYQIDDADVLESVKFALEHNFASIVLQSGERNDAQFVSRVESLLYQIKELSQGKLGITISLGEQAEKTYQRWFAAGAHRYLLRIESTNPELYYKIHPKNEMHNFENRMNCLHLLRKVGYQVGTGVMIGLPFQTLEDLAKDLLFFRDFDVDMVGMGPYIEHSETPLYEYHNMLLPAEERFDLSLKMIAILRIMMKDINIAAATALQTIDKIGREKALKVGANIIMPNITPTINRANYQLYENKPCTDESSDDCINCLEARIHLAGDEIGYGEWGDSKHFLHKTDK